PRMECVHPRVSGGLRRRRADVRIPSEVAEHEILFPIAIEIDRGDTAPPTLAAGKPRLRGVVHETVALLVEYTDRHPLADDDEIETSVIVVVDPCRRRHHPDLRERWRHLRRDVAEVPAPVVLEKIAARRQTVVPRD